MPRGLVPLHWLHWLHWRRPVCALLAASLVMWWTAAAVAQPCERDAARQVGTVEDTRILEASGLEVSTLNPGVVWLHNDSGDGPYLFAATMEGQPLGRWEVTGVTSVDWEDIALGPCPAGTCLFVADTGNNEMDRSDLAIVRLPEPELNVPALQANPAEEAVAGELFPFDYESGVHDAEGLVVHPQSGLLYIVTKSLDGASSLFELDLTNAAPLIARKRAEKTFGILPILEMAITGADISDDGSAMVLRSYNAFYELSLPSGDPAAGWDASPVYTAVTVEKQGEAIAYESDGTTVLTTSEGNTPPIHAWPCQMPVVPADGEILDDPEPMEDLDSESDPSSDSDTDEGDSDEGDGDQEETDGALPPRTGKSGCCSVVRAQVAPSPGSWLVLAFLLALLFRSSGQFQRKNDLFSHVRI